jgi:hypothetical protein
MKMSRTGNYGQQTHARSLMKPVFPWHWRALVVARALPPAAWLVGGDTHVPIGNEPIHSGGIGDLQSSVWGNHERGWRHE